MHSDWSDGKNTIREIAESLHETRAPIYRDYGSLAQPSAIANGLSIERTAGARPKKSASLTPNWATRFRCSPGTEMDIKADGSLDYPDEIPGADGFLSSPLCIRLLGQKREQVTKRLLNAILNPHVNMIGHPSARQFPQPRRGPDADWGRRARRPRASTKQSWRSTPIRSVSISSRSLARMAKDLGVPLGHQHRRPFA